LEIAALSPTPAELRSRLPGLMLRDQHRLGRRIERAVALRDERSREHALGALLAEVDAAAALLDARRLSVPAITYPAELPVSQRKDEIAAAIRDHQVVIVAGETGSGKTTQIPKICLELGRGVAGQIGHTQPRRLAARTVAERIAEELGTEVGGLAEGSGGSSARASTVGYKVRFTDTSSDNTLLKLMTDGILLTEMQHDRRLLRYDTLIIDEAHERSLNIDFILGYLHRLLPSRPDLKVIITSATIDPERFSVHFAGGESGKQSGESSPHGGAAPIVEVSGRTYPVEIRYRPLVPDADMGDEAVRAAEPRDQVQGITDAINELRAEGRGDILVFLSGEREIRDTADALTGDGFADLDVLPLYARLSAAEQHRVFAGGERSRQGESHRGPRVVLATNIAETSLTVPGIKYVIDAGTARISRYSNRTKVQRLPIEPISQASANQRAGRCGRTSDGVCIRLYGEDDYASRPEFTDPEILRTNLASVILQMAALELGEVAGFPFIDPPDTRQVSDGVRLLEELGAFAGERGAGARRGRDVAPLTEIGRKLARLPVDPRLGRMIIEAGRTGCAREMLIIAAALSIQDPRERPADARDAADAQHARFAEPGSDFLSLLNLWDYLRDQQRALSGSAFRRMCRREYLHYLRVREWQDLCGQLRQAAREIGIKVGPDRTPRDPASPAAEPGAQAVTAHVAQLAARPGTQTAERIDGELAERVHRSLLAGLLSHIGVRDVATGQKRRGPAEYTGARGSRFAIFPDSVLARRPPQWVVAAELVETSRLWARVTARIEPEWAEPLAAHLVTRSYSEPHWDGRRGAAVAFERVTLYGLPLVAGRRVTLSRIDPAAARELFISRALVEGDWQTHHKFFHRNRELLAEAEELERRARRRGIVADDAALFDFYDRRIPADVTSARHFDSWWKKARQAEPGLLTLTPADLAGPAADEVSAADYPSSWGGMPLSYEFAPGEPDDGVAADIPLAALNQVSGDEFSWNVPGLREELVTELIRALPKQLRTRFVPAPDVARQVLGRLDPQAGAGLLGALSAELSLMGGVTVPAGAWDLSKLPEYLRVTFRVIDDGQVLASGKDLDELREELRPRLQERLAEAAGNLTRQGITSWDFGSLPRVFSQGQVRAYPALRDAGESVDIALFETPAEADAAMLAGNRRLLLLQVPSGARALASRLPTTAKLAISRHPYASAGDLLDDCAACAADEIIARGGGPAWDAKAFEVLLEAARMSLRAQTADVVSLTARILGEAHNVEVALDRASPSLAAAVADMRAQFAGLIHAGFVSQAGARRLPDLVRYLRAMAHRLEKAPADPGRDAGRTEIVHRVTAEYEQARGRLARAGFVNGDVMAIRWMIEELRVSLFAQPIGAAIPVSEQRILAALDRI
jgi:ATP-dependent helicase HrpA